jgi:hypothetical protein
VSHANVHALLTQTACALATPVVHAFPQVLQFFASLVTSTHEPLQDVAVAGGQPEPHAYVPPEPTHTDVPPEHAWPQLPQFAAVV